jgi:hypothetical protein
LVERRDEMKKQISIVFVMLGLLATIAAPSIRAQFTDVTIRVDIPFDFTVGDTTLPPGKYIITAPEPPDPHILELRSDDGRIGVLFIANTAQATRPPEQTELVFKHIGGRYFLSQIWVQGENSGVQLPNPRPELKLEEKEGNPEMKSVPAQHQKGKPMKK